MYPHGARPSLTPSLSRPRVVPIPTSLPVPLHVTSSRKVHRSADGIINIIQEISFYAEGGQKSLAGKQLKEVHSHPNAQVRGRFSAETNARVFVGERLIRMHIQTAIQPNSSDSLEIDEVFHFAENQEANFVTIAFEATLEREEGERPAVEFDLSSAIVVALKQRILKNSGEQYKVLQAIELRANETEARPTQELARKSTLTQPTNETAQFRERIFAGTDVLRVDRDILFICDRPILSLSERREYTPSFPMAPRRRSASLTQKTPRVSYSPAKPRSRSQSRSLTSDSENCQTANEDLPTATSPYSLYQDESNSRIPPCPGLRTARDASPSQSQPRSSRSQRKKWTVNSVVAKPGASTPERYDRARTMRSLSTARNLSLSPLAQLKTAQARSPNGEIPAIHAVPIVPNIELGPHGECQLVEGMEVLRVVAPQDSLIRTCHEGRSPTRTRSASNCSTANEIPVTARDNNNNACGSPPFSSPRPVSAVSETGEWAYSNVPCTPLRTARDASPQHQRAPSSAALDKRRGLFGYGTRPTTPSRSSRTSAHSPGVRTCIKGASPMRTAQRVVLSPVHTAVHVKSARRSDDHSSKSQKKSHEESKRSQKSSKRNVLKPRRPISIDPPAGYRTPSTTSLPTARNLFGTVASNESVASMLTPRKSLPREASSPSGAVKTARSLASSPYEPAREKSERSASALYYSAEKTCEGTKTARSPAHSPYEKNVVTGRENRTPNKSLRTARHSPYGLPTARGCTDRSPTLMTARHSPYEKTARERSHASPARGLATARVCTDRSPTLMTARQSPYGKSARSPALRTAVPSPYDPNVVTAYETRSPNKSLRTARHSPYEKTARERSHASPARELPTARGNTDRSPTLMTARQSPYGKSARSPALRTAAPSHYDPNVVTAYETRSPIKSLRDAPDYSYVKTARERSHASPARGLPTARGNTDRSPTLKTARQSPYGKSAHSPALRTAAPSPYDPNVVTAYETRSPIKSLRDAPDYSYVKTARERSHASPARGLPTARGSTDRSPTLKTARQSPYAKSARSPALGTADLSPYEQNVMTARAARSPAQSIKTARHSPYEKNVVTGRENRSPNQSLRTARHSPYEKTARERSHASPARGLPTARGNTDRSPTMLTARHSPYDKTARSPADGVRTAAERGRSYGRSPARPSQPTTARSHSPAGDGAYTQIVTARVVRDTTSPLRPSMTARDRTATARSPNVATGRAALNSTMSCISGGRDSDARWTARSAPRSPMATSRTQSPATRSAVSNVVTAQGARSPHVDTESPNNLATAREHRLQPYSDLRTGRGPAVSPMNLKTARESRSAKSPVAPRSALRTAAMRTPEHNTMPDSQARQEDSYSEQSQFTYQQTPSGFTQKPTHSAAALTTGQQRTPTKTDNDSLYYSARQTTPSRTLRPNDVTLAKRTPKRDYSQHAGLESASASPLVRTAVACATPRKQPRVEEVPKCSLKTGCQATHTPRVIPSGPDSDKDMPTARPAVVKTPERSLRTARGPSFMPSAPFGDMRTPRTARASATSPASFLLRSPAASSHLITAISPDAASNSNNSNEDVATARRSVRSAAAPAASPLPLATARHRDWAAAQPTTAAAATTKPRVIVHASQADGKITVELCLTFKLNTTGTIRLRGEMAPSLNPRTVSVNGQQIWSNASRH